MKKENKVINMESKMCLLRNITYGEFSEFVQEKKEHINFSCTIFGKITKVFSPDLKNQIKPSLIACAS